MCPGLSHSARLPAACSAQSPLTACWHRALLSGSYTLRRQCVERVCPVQEEAKKDAKGAKRPRISAVMRASIQGVESVEVAAEVVSCVVAESGDASSLVPAVPTPDGVSLADVASPANGAVVTAAVGSTGVVAIEDGSGGWPFRCSREMVRGYVRSLFEMLPNAGMPALTLPWP